MEEENTVLTEQGETAETSADFDAAFDTGWGEDDSSSPDGEAGAGTEGTEADADQQDADESDGGEEEDGDSAEGEGKGDEGNPDQGESYTIKHLGEERTVSGHDNIVALLQKGYDYDRVREKWDGVKDDVPKLRMYETFLKELADARGSDIESLIDETRVRAMMAQAEARGEKLDAATAAARAVRARLQGNAQAEKKPEPESQSDPDHPKGDMIGDFLAVYGGTVKAEDIPPEVWAEAKEKQDLLGPYQRYENRKLQDENRKLKEELEATKKQQKNKARSTGSSKSVGAGAALDPFDEGWNMGQKNNGVK